MELVGLGVAIVLAIAGWAVERSSARRTYDVIGSIELGRCKQLWAGRRRRRVVHRQAAAPGNDRSHRTTSDEDLHALSPVRTATGCV